MLNNISPMVLEHFNYFQRKYAAKHQKKINPGNSSYHRLLNLRSSIIEHKFFSKIISVFL